MHKRNVLLIHYICSDCGREWWIESAQQTAYRDATTRSVDCPYCSMRAPYSYSVDAAGIREMRV